MSSRREPFDLLKNSSRSNNENWLKETTIISYGVVIEVVTDNIAQVEHIIRRGAAHTVSCVPVLSISSSHFEQASRPAVGDLVLLLSMNLYNRAMFDLPQGRYEASGKKDWSIKDSDATGYNTYSMVGILLAPARGFAETVIKNTVIADVPTVSMQSRAACTAIFKREMNVLFDAIPGSGGFVDRVVAFTFGVHSPAEYDYQSTVTRRHGFAVKNDKTLENVDATVTEEYSPNAPVVKNFQAAQDITVGKAHSPAGDPAGAVVDVDADITVTIGSKADVNIVSESDLDVSFNEMRLNGSSKRLVTWQELQDALTTLCATLAAHTHPSNGATSPGLAGLTCSITAAKTTTIKTGG